MAMGRCFFNVIGVASILSVARSGQFARRDLAAANLRGARVNNGRLDADGGTDCWRRREQRGATFQI